MRSFRPIFIVPLGAVAFFFAGYVLYPLVVTVAESVHANNAVSFANYLQVLSPQIRANWEAVGNSVLVSILTVIFAGVVGVLFAFVFTQYHFPFRTLLSRLAILPIALPPLVGVISFLFVFGEGGMIPRVLQVVLNTQQVPFSLDGIAAIVVVHVYSFYVYFYLFASSVLRQLDASVLEAAAGLGSKPFGTFRRVIIPELRPALVGASILTFMSSMASFSAPLLLGGGMRFMTTQIYSTKLNGELPLAAAQSVLLTLVSVVFFVGLRLAERQRPGSRGTKGTAKVRLLETGRLWRLVSMTLCMALLFVELLPMLTIVLISFVREGSWTWQILPTVFTADNYLKLLGEPHIFEPVRNSLVMSAGTLLVAVMMGVTVAYFITKGVPQRVRLLVDVLVTLPFAVPGTVVAISLILAFNSPSLLSGYSVLVGSLWILPLAYLIRTYPLVIRSTTASLEQFDDSLTEAAASFGAGVLRRFLKIVLPLILPGIVSGGLLCVIAALGEFVSSILLYTYASRPISVEIFSQLRAYNFGAAAAYCVFLLCLIMVLISLGNSIVRRVARRGDGIDF